MSATDFETVLEFDPAGDGSFSEDSTNRLLKATVRRGRADALSPMRPGRMSLTLQNRDGRFSPHKGTIAGFDVFCPVRLWAAYQAPAGTKTNLLVNPSAETNSTNWNNTGGGSIAVISTDSWCGDDCVEKTTANAGDSGVLLTAAVGTRVAVSAGTAYSLSAYLKGSGSKVIKLEIRWYNSATVGTGSLLQTDNATVTLVSGWVRPGLLNVTAPVGATHAELYIATNSAQGVFTFKIDAAMFYAGAAHEVYIDGSQPGCSWSGTAHASTSFRASITSYLLFQGYVHSIAIRQDKMNQTAEVECVDFLALLPQINVSLGNMVTKETTLIMHRLIDKLEPELISEGLEWMSTATHPIGAGTSKYTSRNGATIGAYRLDTSGDVENIVEGDWSISAITSAGSSLSGWRYDATGDIDATGSYVISVYARVTSGTKAMRFRFLRDAVVEHSSTFTLTTDWQRLAIEVSFSTLGTNRYIELVSDAAGTATVMADCLHAVERARLVRRSVDSGGISLVLPVNAYREPAHSVLGDVVESEPGLLYVENGPLGTGINHGALLRFAARTARTGVVARAVFGDGDGLLQFDDGMGYTLDALDRIGAVSISSRGQASLSPEVQPCYDFPDVATTTGDEFAARYNHPVRAAYFQQIGGADIEVADRNYGIGADIEITTGDASSAFSIVGRKYTYHAPAVVTRRSSSLGVPVENHLSVQMPWHGDNSTDVENEADRLLAKYENNVVRMALPLHMRDDAVQLWQYDLEIGDCIVVRAENEDHSPGLDKRFFVEGMAHTIDGQARGAIKTTLLLEEE